MRFSDIPEHELSRLLHDCKSKEELSQILASVISEKDEVNRKLRGILGQRQNRPANAKQNKLTGDFVRLTRYEEIVKGRYGTP